MNVAALAQQSLNTQQIGHLQYTERLSEVRGALHNGGEYALVGVFDGFSIVDVSTPASPTEVFFEPGAETTWRDPFYHDGYAYCVNEGNGGMLIVDMGPLPGSTNLNTATYTGSQFPWGRAHNMYIDTIAERAYIFGSDHGNGGAIILDISDPMSPVELGEWDDFYIHDGFVRGDTLWAACLGDGAFVVDVSDPTQPQVLVNWQTPSNFAHNIWPSDDNSLAFTTDEVGSGFVAAYDMSDLQNVVEIDRVNHPLTEGVIPHNTHVMGDFLITSHYRDGLTIHDASEPDNIILTGYFDSSPLSGGGFDGAWGAWPYLPSGNLLAADIQEGLFVLSAEYTLAARIQGTVTDDVSGNPLSGVQVEVVGADVNELTDIFGTYASGTPEAGTFDVTFQKGGYLPQTITDVELVNGTTVTLEVQLVPDVPFSFGGMVIETGSSTPIGQATVELENEFFDLTATTETDGSFTIPDFFAGTYDVTVGSWGHVTACTTITVTEGAPAPTLQLEEGYYDDFALDLGWTVNGNATAGIWTRETPNGTAFNGTPANPDQDAQGGCGAQAFVTGNALGPVNIDDVDDGVTILTSPVMDLSGMTEPVFRFHYWFFNQGGNTDPNDEFIVRLSNGDQTETLASLPVTADVWTEAMLTATDLSITDQIQLSIHVDDRDPGHLVEGGFDLFEVIESTSVQENAEEKFQVHAFPNPASDMLHLKLEMPHQGTAVATVHDLSGKQVMTGVRLRNGLNSIPLHLSAGMYLLQVEMDGHRIAQPIIVKH